MRVFYIGVRAFLRIIAILLYLSSYVGNERENEALLNVMYS